MVGNKATRLSFSLSLPLSNSLLIVVKNGALRLCFSQRPLNHAIQLHHFQISIFDDVIDEMRGRKYLQSITCGNDSNISS